MGDGIELVKICWYFFKSSQPFGRKSCNLCRSIIKLDRIIYRSSSPTLCVCVCQVITLHHRDCPWFFMFSNPIRHPGQVMITLYDTDCWLLDIKIYSSKEKVVEFQKIALIGYFQMMCTRFTYRNKSFFLNLSS